jgi:hypothetical protein
VNKDGFPRVEAERPRLGRNVVIPAVFYACAVLAAAGVYELIRTGTERAGEKKAALEAEAEKHREVLALNRQLESKRELLRGALQTISCVKGDEDLSPKLRDFDQEAWYAEREKMFRGAKELIRKEGEMDGALLVVNEDEAEGESDQE